MIFRQQIEYHDLRTTVRLGGFTPASCGVTEFHAMIEIDACFSASEKQYQMLEETVQRMFNNKILKGSTLIWKHFFVSDAINQSCYFSASSGEAVSVVQQPPLNGSKASMWLYFVEEAKISKDSVDTTIMERPGYTHLFSTRLHERSEQSTSGAPLMPLPSAIGHQTRQIFNRYCQNLRNHGCTLLKNCIRTWIFVQNIDVQYSGMVKARREYFEREGLTPQTHFIASTGIEGRYVYPDVLVLIDAYAISGIEDSQIKHLRAPAHLNPTHEYGVTFERGTSVDYGDRRHIFISGTASINNRGEIVFPLDVEKQTAHSFENVKALLAEAEADLDDVVQMIVYMRDTADFDVVNQYMNTHHPAIPRIIVLAQVCRPGWLVELECIAIKDIEKKQFANF